MLSSFVQKSDKEQNFSFQESWKTICIHSYVGQWPENSEHWTGPRAVFVQLFICILSTEREESKKDESSFSTEAAKDENLVPAKTELFEVSIG